MIGIDQVHSCRLIMLFQLFKNLLDYNLIDDF